MSTVRVEDVAPEFQPIKQLELDAVSATHFLSHLTIVSEGCWLWTGPLDTDGYGNAQLKGRVGGAHRLLFEALVGPVPDGLELDHLCRNKACVRPSHLQPVSHRENVLRGVSIVAKTAQRTHCQRGHPLVPENVYSRQRDPRPYRRCRVCLRMADAEAARLRRARAGEAPA